MNETALNMDTEDEIYVLIVSNNVPEEELNIKEEIDIKIEKPESYDGFIQENLLNNLQEIKEEVEDYSYENFSATAQTKRETPETHHSKSIKKRIKRTNNKRAIKTRIKKEPDGIIKPYNNRNMPKPDPSMTIVNQIKKNFPDVVGSEDILVNILYEYMLHEKAPEPPPGYYVKIKQKFQCTLCKKLLPTKFDVKQHYQRIHGPRYLVCYACGVNFKNKACYRKHENRCKGDGIISVLKARARIVERSGKNVNGFRVDHLCHYCPKIFKSSMQLEQHENDHLGIKPFQCDQCPAAFTYKVAFKNHTYTHKKATYICDVCSRELANKANMIKHSTLHMPKKTYECDICSYSSPESASFKVHMRQEHNMSPPPPNRRKPKFQCTQCPAKFTSKGTLTAHENFHQGIRPYECETCNASYTSKGALKHHKLKHIGPQLICDHCGHISLSKVSIRRHIQSHYQSKRYTCKECSKTYAYKFGLNNHVNRVHKKLPSPCACQLCPKRYCRMYLLKDHMMKEHGILLVTKRMLYNSMPKMSNEEAKKIVLNNDSIE